jgi:hypothetical protein
VIAQPDPAALIFERIMSSGFRPSVLKMIKALNLNYAEGE